MYNSFDLLTRAVYRTEVLTSKAEKRNKCLKQIFPHVMDLLHCVLRREAGRPG